MNPTPRSARAQRGFVLLLTLIVLIVLLFGVLFVIRGTLLQTVMTGNTMQRQKDVQAGDLALRIVENTIVQSSQGAGSVPLEISASGQSWFYVPTTTPWTVPTTTAYWSSCSAGSSTAPCASVSGLPSSYSASYIVVPTNLPTDPYACLNTGYTAVYYDIFIHTSEVNGVTAANTETVFKLCTVS
jgi:Tfp pilus assembly protein PilX